MNLNLYVYQARNLRKVQTFGNQSPVAVITVGERKFQTSVSENTGKEAKWDDLVEITVDGNTKNIFIEVYDKKISSGSMIGMVGIAIAQLFQNRGYLNRIWLPISHESGFISKSKKPAGEIEIEIEPLVAYKPREEPLSKNTTKSGSKLSRGSQGSNGGRTSLRNTGNLLTEPSLTKPKRRSITTPASTAPMPGAIGAEGLEKKPMPLPVPNCYPGGFIPPVKLNDNKNKTETLTEVTAGNFSPPKAQKKDAIPPPCRFEPPDNVALPSSTDELPPRFSPPAAES